MTTFLILSPGNASEWKNDFSAVQTEMNNLEASGVVSNVTVQKFVNNKLDKSLTYNYNGQAWELNK